MRNLLLPAQYYKTDGFRFNVKTKNGLGADTMGHL